MKRFNRLVRVLREIDQSSRIADRELLRVLALGRVVAGEDVALVSTTMGFSRKNLEQKAEAIRDRDLIGVVPDLEDRTTEQKLQRMRKGIAQMLLGSIAERHFENAAREMTGGRRLRIEDHRGQRSDTDYRLLNGEDRPIFRMNIKFHGSLFRQAREQVGLEPADCFALATYKINSALEKQRAEDLPYVFFVVSAPTMSAETVGRLIPDDYAWTQAVLGGRTLEEAIVQALLTEHHLPAIQPVVDAVSSAEFRVLSVARADRILREKLFQRVFALRQRNFNQAFRNAEIDLHISLHNEMTPIADFFQAVATESTQRLVIQLWEGKF